MVILDLSPKDQKTIDEMLNNPVYMDFMTKGIEEIFDKADSPSTMKDVVYLLLFKYAMTKPTDEVLGMMLSLLLVLVDKISWDEINKALDGVSFSTIEKEFTEAFVKNFVMYSFNRSKKG